MNRKTLLALGVAGALGCSAASATTYLCEFDPADVSYKACAEIMSDVLASSPAVNYVLASEPAVVTYYTIEPAHELVWFVPESSIEPASAGMAATESWLQPEPVLVTYYYAFDSALDGSAADQ